MVISERETGRMEGELLFAFAMLNLKKLSINLKKSSVHISFVIKKNLVNTQMPVE